MVGLALAAYTETTHRSYRFTLAFFRETSCNLKRAPSVDRQRNQRRTHEGALIPERWQLQQRRSARLRAFLRDGIEKEQERESKPVRVTLHWPMHRPFLLAACYRCCQPFQQLGKALDRGPHGPRGFEWQPAKRVCAGKRKRARGPVMIRHCLDRFRQ